MKGHTLFRIATVVAFALTYVTIILGGNVMATGSGLACPDWPTCHGTLLPPLAGAILIEWSHRLAAAALIGTLLLLAVVGSRAEAERPMLRRMAYASLAIVTGQALLGGLVVLSDLTAGVVLLHLFLATVLFGVLLVLAALANIRDVPRRWLDWAWNAADGRPHEGPAPRPEPNPGAPATPSAGPLPP